MGDPIVVFDSVKKTGIDGSRIVEILADATFTIEEGDIVVFYGPSGSGKTTILNIISGFDRPSGGKATVYGVDIGSAKWGQLVELRRTRIAYAMQANLVLPRLTVEANIALPLLLRGSPLGEALEKARSMAELLGIGHTLERRMHTLSGGEVRRAVVARALVVEAPLTILDEPTSNLDEDTSKTVWRVIEEMRDRRGVTVVVATHDKLGLKTATRVVRVEDGRTMAT